MKRILAFALAAVIALTLLCSCGKGVTLEYNGDGNIDGKNGAVYAYAPVGYEPTEQGREYGVIEGTIPETVYAIGDLDTALWLTSEYSGAATTVYYSVDIDLPSLSEMAPKLCYVCEQGDKVYSIYTVGDSANGKVDEEREVIDKIVKAVTDEESGSEFWPRMGASDTYNLKFYSEDWPAIYYNLLYVRDGGEDYVYDRATKKCVCVGDIIHDLIGNE